MLINPMQKNILRLSPQDIFSGSLVNFLDKYINGVPAKEIIISKTLATFEALHIVITSYIPENAKKVNK